VRVTPAFVRSKVRFEHVVKCSGSHGGRVALRAPAGAAARPAGVPGRTRPARRPASPLPAFQANWDTDIAAELSDYLAQLEDISFSFDGGSTSLNFAEAALLIQGSTCVYSRKVEYLHKLVFNALEAVAAKRCAHWQLREQSC
jgi:Condensin II complex subunit CAP-H2 or CNDH2, N-terminal